MLLLSGKSIAQKTEFGLTVEGSIPFLSTKHNTSLQSNQELYYPSEDRFVASSNLWSSSTFKVDIYPHKVKGLKVSFGISYCRYSYYLDSISHSEYVGSLFPPTGSWETYCGSRTVHNGYIIPDFSVGYDVRLTDWLFWRNSAAIGVFRFINQYWRKSIAYDPNDQDVFDYNDQGYEKFGYDFSINQMFDFELGSGIGLRKNQFSAALMPTLLYFKRGEVSYTGFHVGASVSYRFNREANQ